MSARAASLSGVAADLISLTKPRLSSLVLCTAAGGMYLAPGEVSPPKLLVMLLATYGVVGAANAINCWFERDSDRYMRRTRNRPLPSGRMEPQVALGFGITLAAISIPALMVAANVATGVLGLIAFLLYTLVYTPMKAKSHLAMVVGAIPGAIPPLMGWVSATGRIDLPGLVLFGILFFWQLPHFLAIALFRKEEYQAAGLHSVPLDRGDGVARAQALMYLVLLFPMTLMPTLLGLTGWVYFAVAVALSGLFLGLGAYGFFKKLGAPWARKLFFTSLVHLAGLFIVLMIDGGRL